MVALAISSIIILFMFPVYEKYNRLDNILTEMSELPYGNNKCLDFSNIAIEELKKIGIQAELVIGESPATAKENWRHSWIAIWIEPQTGEFTKEYYK